MVAARVYVRYDCQLPIEFPADFEKLEIVESINSARFRSNSISAESTQLKLLEVTRSPAIKHATESNYFVH